jgi:hypothetical protein
MPNVIAQAGGLLVGGSTVNMALYTWVDGQYAICNQAFRVPTSGFSGGLTMGDCALAYLNAVDAALQAIITIETKILGVKCSQFRDVPGDVPLAGIATSTDVGSVANPTAAKQTALVITKTTLVGGKRGRGRMYLPPPGVSAIDLGGEPTAAYLALAATFYGAVYGFSSLTIGPANAVFIAAVHGKVILGFIAQTSFIVRPRFGTQRRRGAYGRPNPDSIL